MISIIKVYVFGAEGEYGNLNNPMSDVAVRYVCPECGGEDVGIFDTTEKWPCKPIFGRCGECGEQLEMLPEDEQMEQLRREFPVP